jgi:hypothetical protein
MNLIQERINEIEEQQRRLQEEKLKLLTESKEGDLRLVRELCERHGFTATDLKGAIKLRGRGRPAVVAKPKRDPNVPKRKYTRRAKAAG